MTIKKARMVWKTVAFCVFTPLFFVVCTVLAYNLALYRQSRVLLSTVQMIKVGSVLDVGTIESAKRLKAIVFSGVPQGSSTRYEYFYVDQSTWASSRFATEFKPVSFDYCMSDSCAISFPASTFQVDRASQLFARHPRTLLPVFYWIYGFQKPHHWLPIAWLDPVTIKVEKGIVKELDMRMRSEAIDGSSCPRAEVHIRVADPTTASWEVTPTRIVHTGGDCGEDVGVQVHATTDATRGQLEDAFDFNLHCLLPGGSCTECDMLPNVCHKYVNAIPPTSAVNVPSEAVSEILARDPSWRVAQALIRF
jgi:hypothetical protein